jgi:hypothetical protein
MAVLVSLFRLVMAVLVRPSDSLMAVVVRPSDSLMAVVVLLAPSFNEETSLSTSAVFHDPASNVDTTAVAAYGSAYRMVWCTRARQRAGQARRRETHSIQAGVSICCRGKLGSRARTGYFVKLFSTHSSTVCAEDDGEAEEDNARRLTCAERVSV